MAKHMFFRVRVFKMFKLALVLLLPLVAHAQFGFLGNIIRGFTRGGGGGGGLANIFRPQGGMIIIIIMVVILIIMVCSIDTRAGK